MLITPNQIQGRPQYMEPTYMEPTLNKYPGNRAEPTKSIISERFELLDKLISENKELLLQLQSRLQLVMSPTPPPSQQPDKDTTSPILMVVQLENLCAAIESNNQQIRNILQNIGL